MNTTLGYGLLVAALIGFALVGVFRRELALGPALILSQAGVSLLAALVAWIYMKSL